MSTTTNLVAAVEERSSSCAAPKTIWQRVRTKLYKGYHPKYVWKDGKIGGTREYVGCGDEEQTWIVFFIDLCFVAYVSRMSHVLTTCLLTDETLVLIIFMSNVCHNLRMSMVDYSVRFYTDDFLHRMLLFAHIGGIVIMVMTIEGATGMQAATDATGGHGGDGHTDQPVCSISYEDLGAYVAGYSIARNAVFLLQLVQRLNDSSGKFQQQYNLRMLTGMLANILTIVGANLTGNTTTTLALLYISCEIESLINAVVIYVNRFMQVPFFKLLTTYHYPQNVFMVQESTGIFVMVYIGEGVIKFAEVSFLSLDREDLISYFFVLVLLFSFSSQYYDRVQRREHEEFAPVRNVFWGFVWFYLHRWLVVCILFVTSGFTDNSVTGTHMLSAGCGMLTLTMIAMRMLHKGFKYRFGTWKRIAYLCVELAVVLAHWLLYLAPEDSELTHAGTIALHAMLSFLYISFDTLSVFFYIDSDNLLTTGSGEKPAAEGTRPESTASRSTTNRISISRYALDDSSEDQPGLRMD